MFHARAGPAGAAAFQREIAVDLEAIVALAAPVDIGQAADGIAVVWPAERIELDGGGEPLFDRCGAVDLRAQLLDPAPAKMTLDEVMARIRDFAPEVMIMATTTPTFNSDTGWFAAQVKACYVPWNDDGNDGGWR